MCQPIMYWMDICNICKYTNHNHDPSCTLMLKALVVELLYHNPTRKCTHHSKKILTQHGKLLLSYFNAFRVILITKNPIQENMLMICRYFFQRDFFFILETIQGLFFDVFLFHIWIAFDAILVMYTIMCYINENFCLFVYKWFGLI